jgi:hypothetical protein
MPLPSQGAIATYWIPDVGIGPKASMRHVHVPLLDILKFPTNIVFLGFARFTSQSDAYLTIPIEIVKEMTLQPGQTRTNVQELQAAGIKVLLSIQGSKDYGWNNISDPAGFAKWVQEVLIDKYGLDGVDIDDEWSDVKNKYQDFMNAIGHLRASLTGSLLTKALWMDIEFFKTPVAAGFPNVGRYLGQLLDFGGEMTYTGDAAAMVRRITAYHDVVVGGKNVGMGWNQLLIGVQAGPKGVSNFTDIQAVYNVSKWSVEPVSQRKPIPPILGIMLYTFSQDIQQFTYGKQNEEGKMFPNPDDHQWHRTIVAGITGQPKPDH